MTFNFIISVMMCMYIANCRSVFKEILCVIISFIVYDPSIRCHHKHFHQIRYFWFGAISLGKSFQSCNYISWCVWCNLIYTSEKYIRKENETFFKRGLFWYNIFFINHNDTCSCTQLLIFMDFIFHRLFLMASQWNQLNSWYV